MPSRPRSISIFSTFSKRGLSPGPPSPTFSDATQVSAFNFGPNGPSKIITRENLKESLGAYEDLVESCSSYRAALVAMSNATAAFADAMQRCSGLKGPTYEAGTRLQAASGMHHLMGNLWQVLSDTLDKNVEQPLRQQLESYRTAINDRSQAYEQSLKAKSRLIHETETRGLNRKQRNLQSFREALGLLQRQVDELDELKASHYQEIVDHEEEVWDEVQAKVCVAVRSTMDVFDRVTAKASDPVIEPMLQTVPDPFDSYGPPQTSDQIFSILAPLSIMSPSPSPSPVIGTPSDGHYNPHHHHSYVGHSQHASGSLSSGDIHGKITSWLPSSTNGYAGPVIDQSTEWAGGRNQNGSSTAPSGMVVVTDSCSTSPMASGSFSPKSPSVLGVTSSLGTLPRSISPPPPSRGTVLGPIVEQHLNGSSSAAAGKGASTGHGGMGGPRGGAGRMPFNPSLLINTSRGSPSLSLPTSSRDAEEKGKILEGKEQEDGDGDEEDRGQATPRFSTFFSRAMSSLTSSAASTISTNTAGTNGAGTEDGKGEKKEDMKDNK